MRRQARALGRPDTDPTSHCPKASGPSYRQILLVDELPGFGRQRILRDMDSSYRCKHLVNTVAQACFSLLQNAVERMLAGLALASSLALIIDSFF